MSDNKKSKQKQQVSKATDSEPDGNVNQNHNTKKVALGPNTKR